MTTLNMIVPMGTVRIHSLEGDALRSLRDRLEPVIGADLSRDGLIDPARLARAIVLGFYANQGDAPELTAAMLVNATLERSDDTRVELDSPAAILRVFDGQRSTVLLDVLVQALRLHFLSETGRAILVEKMN